MQHTSFQMNSQLVVQAKSHLHGLRSSSNFLVALKMSAYATAEVAMKPWFVCSLLPLPKSTVFPSRSVTLPPASWRINTPPAWSQTGSRYPASRGMRIITSDLPSAIATYRICSEVISVPGHAAPRFDARRRCVSRFVVRLLEESTKRGGFKLVR